MLTNPLYHNWLKKIMQQFPEERITRQKNLARMLAGVFASKSVHLSKIASKIPGTAKLTSMTRRLDRFLENPAFRVRDWYEPIMKELLEQRIGQEIRLIVDGSKVGFGHQLLMVSLAYRKRAIPLAWMWIRCSRGHSSAGRQLALLNYILKFLPANTTVLLVGDSEFGAIEVLRWLDLHGWKYVLRQKGKHLVRDNEKSPWVSLSSFLQKASQSLWLDRKQLTRLHAYKSNIAAYWKIGENEPWLLATNLPSLREALRAYERRMWIEEMFGDLKDNGFDLEATRLRSIIQTAPLDLHRRFALFGSGRFCFQSDQSRSTPFG